MVQAITTSRIDVRKVVAEKHWRLRIDTYAEHVSQGRWTAYPHVKYALERIQAGILKGGYRGIINWPPRHGKSEAISHWTPTWYLDHFPEHRVVLTSYVEKLASKFGLMVRDEFTRNERTMTRVRDDKSVVNDWYTEENGGMRTVGVGGSLIGMGGNLILIDDPHKNWEEANSETFRQKLVDWYYSTLRTRLEPGGSIILIMQRWHELDLTGFLLDQDDEDWDHIRLPAFAEDNDPLGREIGAPLFPERWPADELNGIKKGAPGQVWAGMFQQRPSPEEGDLVQREWFRYYDTLPEETSQWLVSWDLSFKKTTRGSFVVGQVWCKSGPNFYLIDQYRRRVDFPTTLKAFKNLLAIYPQVGEKLVEDAANGPAVISTLKQEIPGIIAVPTRGASKTSRLSAVTHLIEAGNVYLPNPNRASWVKELVEELMTFPNAAHDDQVDALSMALSRYKGSIRGKLNMNLGMGLKSASESPWRY